jgi:hypothetical protein
MGIGDQNADRCCHTPHKQDKIRGAGGGGRIKKKKTKQKEKKRGKGEDGRIINTKPEQMQIKDEIPGHS